MSTNQRIRGRKLQTIRRRLFDGQPLCVQCQAKGRVSLATERDHIVPIFRGGLDTPDNTQALCAACHETKTRSEGSRKLVFGVDGWPIGER